jgi:F420-dependent methylenetetrahydromethanopterin dehydrogenase
LNITGKSPQNYSPVPKLNFDSMKNSTVPVMVLPPPPDFKSKKEIEQDNGLKKLPMMKVNNLDYGPKWRRN